MRPALTPAAALLALLSGCFVGTTDAPVSGGGNGVNGNGNGSCTTCRRTSGGNGNGNGAGGSSTGGGTTGGGTTDGSTGSGTAGGTSTGVADGGCDTVSTSPPVPFDCTGISTFYDGTAGSCPGDWFGTAITDYFTCAPVCGLGFQLLDSNGLPIAGASQESDSPTGFVHLCLSKDQAYTPSVGGGAYATFYYGEIQGEVSYDVPSLGVFPTNDISALGPIIGGLDPTKASAIFFVFAMTETCGSLAQAAGWTISLAFPDGGAYPSGSYSVVYVDDTGVPSSSLTQTSTYGVAFVTNIDTSLGSFVTPVYGNADAGPCTVQNEALGFTGRLFVAPGDFSEQGVFLP